MQFTLRPWKPEDIDSLVKYANNPNIACFMTDGFPYPYTKENGARFIKMATASEPIHIFAIDVNSEAVGGIGIHPQQDIMKKNAELGYWLAEPFWGKGIVSNAIKKMIDFAFETYDINRIYARPFGNNKASQHVLEKCGFIKEAHFEKTVFKNGEFQDELVFAYRKKII